jgi:hypothetical protein
LKVLAVYRDHDQVIGSLESRRRAAWFERKTYSLVRRRLHRLFWKPYLMWEKRNWSQCWMEYNQSILNFKANYPDDILIIKLDSLFGNWEEILSQISVLINIRLKRVDVESVYIGGLLTKRNVRHAHYDKIKIKEITTKLNEVSIG